MPKQFEWNSIYEMCLDLIQTKISQTNYMATEFDKTPYCATLSQLQYNNTKGENKWKVHVIHSTKRLYCRRCKRYILWARQNEDKQDFSKTHCIRPNIGSSKE